MAGLKKILRKAKLDTTYVNINSPTVTTGAIPHEWNLKKNIEKSNFEKCRNWSPDYMMQCVAQTLSYVTGGHTSVTNTH